VRFPLYLVDAFADRAFAGNPAAICFLEFWLFELTMQSIAAEMKSFRDRVPRADPRGLAHPLVHAAAFVIFERVAQGVAETRFTSLSGPLVVRRDGALLAMDLPARVPVPCAPPPGLVDGLGAAPVEVLAAQHYLAVFENEDAVRALRPHMDRLTALDRAAVIVTAPGRTADSIDFISRFFAPANGVPEDPVSGVAHCTLIPYWSRRLGKNRSRRGGSLVCEDRGDRVVVSGPAVLVLEGTFVLDAA
jgi:predicted PhzF superfamily epimerase YddE/YHI9